MRLWLAIGFSATLIAAAAMYSRLPSTRETGLFDVDPPTPYSRYANPQASNPGRVLTIHGLSANKGMMNQLSYGLADAGFEVFAIDLPGHGQSLAPFNAVRTRETVAQILDELGADTSVIGHSLGGGLLLDIAANRSITNMVLFSPPPAPIETINSQRVLLFTAQFDPGRMRAFAPQVSAAAKGDFELRELGWTGHSGGLIKPDVIRQVAAWLGGDASQVSTPHRQSLLIVMAASSLGLGIVLLWPPQRPASTHAVTTFSRQTILIYMSAAGIALAILSFIPFTSWLHLFGTDYLMGFQFLAGLGLCMARPRSPLASRQLFAGLAAAVYLIAIPGAFVISEFVDVMLSGGRWWRFLAFLVLGLPFFVGDENLLRPIRSTWRAAGGMLLTRLILWAMVVTSVLMWRREDAFLVLVMHLIVFFWIVLWFASALVYRRTQNRLATALFAAIVQAWFFAAIFVTT